MDGNMQNHNTSPITLPRLSLTSNLWHMGALVLPSHSGGGKSYSPVPLHVRTSWPFNLYPSWQVYLTLSLYSGSSGESHDILPLVTPTGFSHVTTVRSNKHKLCNCLLLYRQLIKKELFPPAAVAPCCSFKKKWNKKHLLSHCAFPAHPALKHCL